MQLRDQVTNFINKFAGKSITPESIKAFYQGLVDELDVNIHPDDDFNVYVETGTDEQTFKPYEAEMLNKIAEAMFEFCDRKGLDIYSIATPDHMKQIMGDNINENLEGPGPDAESLDDEEIYKTAFNGYPEDSFDTLKETINGKILDAGYNNPIDSISIDDIKASEVNGICSASAYVSIAFRAEIPENVRETFDQVVHSSAAVLNLKQGNWAISGNEGNTIYLQIRSDNKDDVNDLHESNNLEEAFNPKNIEAVETLFETDLLDAVENHFHLDDTNQLFQSSELYNEGDFVIESDSKSIYLEIVVSEESYSVMNYDELGKWFAEFCDHNGLSGQNSEILTSEDNHSVTFLLTISLKSKFGMRESERHIYKANENPINEFFGMFSKPKFGKFDKVFYNNENQPRNISNVIKRGSNIIYILSTFDGSGNAEKEATEKQLRLAERSWQNKELDK